MNTLWIINNCLHCKILIARTYKMGEIKQINIKNRTY